MTSTYSNVYDAVMDGMGGDYITEHELCENNGAGNNARSALRAMKILLKLERGESVNMFVNLATGMDSYYEDGVDNRAVAAAKETHPSNDPRVYEVVRNTRGYKVKQIYGEES